MVRLEGKPKHLTDLFYQEYSHCSKMLKKKERPYGIAVLTISDLKFAIPFRSNIKHTYSYILRESEGRKSGLDFTKAVVIKNEHFIGRDAMINSDEFSQFIKKKTVISNRFKKFIKDYKGEVTDPRNPRMQKVVQYSPLKYFHEELGLNS